MGFGVGGAHVPALGRRVRVDDAGRGGVGAEEHVVHELELRHIVRHVVERREELAVLLQQFAGEGAADGRQDAVAVVAAREVGELRARVRPVGRGEALRLLHRRARRLAAALRLDLLHGGRCADDAVDEGAGGGAGLGRHEAAEDEVPALLELRDVHVPRRRHLLRPWDPARSRTLYKTSARGTSRHYGF